MWDDCIHPQWGPGSTEKFVVICSVADTFLALFSNSLCWAQRLGVGDSTPGLASVLGTSLLLACPLISALPVVRCWETHLSSCDPVVSKATDECLISALTAGSAAFPCPVRCPPCVVPDTTSAPASSAVSPFASGCAALYCIQHHRNLSVCPPLGFGAQGSWGVGTGCSDSLFPGQGLPSSPDPSPRTPQKEEAPLR